MLGFGFGVRHIPIILPDIVFALFTGLNSAAVGLIAVAAYDLSAKVITDPITRIEVLLSAAFSTCYESQWLYPVLMVVGGMATLVWDNFVLWKENRSRRLSQENCSSSVSHVREANHSGLPRSDAVFGDIEMQEQDNKITEVTQTVSRSELPNNSGLSQRSGIEKPEAVVGSVKDAEPEPSEYFKMSVTTGLFMYAFPLCINIFSVSFHHRTAAFVIFLVIMIVLKATALHQRAFSFFVNLLIAGTIIFVSIRFN